MDILVVDDSSFIILVCKQALEKAGHRIIGEAYDGLEAVEKAQALRPDLVIMDIALPKKNGLEAAVAISASLPQTKILSISAIEEEWVRSKALASGCIDFLPKPFEVKHLIETVDRLMKAEGNLKYG